MFFYHRDLVCGYEWHILRLLTTLWFIFNIGTCSRVMVAAGWTGVEEGGDARFGEYSKAMSKVGAMRTLDCWLYYVFGTFIFFHIRRHWAQPFLNPRFRVEWVEAFFSPWRDAFGGWSQTIHSDSLNVLWDLNCEWNHGVILIGKQTKKHYYKCTAGVSLKIWNSHLKRS